MGQLTFETVLMVVTEHLTYGNYSQATIKSVFYALRRLDGYLSGIGKADYRDVNQTDIYDFGKYLLKKEGNRKETFFRYGARLKQAFLILEKEEMILISPFNDISDIKLRKIIRDKVLTEKETKVFLESIDGTTPCGFRNRTIFEVFYGTGIRLKELLNLELSDFLREEKMLFIRNGKGKKDRILPLGKNIAESLIRYLKETRPKLVNRRLDKKTRTQYLFVGLNGVKFTAHGLEKVVRNLRKGIGLTDGVSNDQERISDIFRKVSPHVIRHSFATHLINAGADIREVQLLLGHKCIDSTEVYLNLAAARLKEVYEKFHPLENELYFDVMAREAENLEGRRKR